MLISRKTLSQYIDISKYSINELATMVTSAGLEVEGIETLASGDNLIIGEIVECVKHEEADKLNVCKVNIGKEVLQIVCGAPNARVGIKVIVAQVGAKLPEITISKGNIRGVESCGMMCSLLELGVDEKSLTDEQKNGIEELDTNAVVGNEDVLGYLGLDDEILDIGLTPNRNDCLASWSMAKEVAAIVNQKANIPYAKDYDNEGSDTKFIVNSETDKCKLFYGKVINNLEIKQSPKWIKEVLTAANIKSINNVVDISNIVMLETGQPLHFYDLTKLEKQEITVKDGLNTTYTALDGIEYNISENDLMITCNNKPIGIAGVMGGEDSKISEDTKSIFIEAASFNHVSIRNSARNLNLNTDASARFIKGIEPLAAKKAMDRAVELLIEYANATNLEKTTKYDITKYEDTIIEVSYSKINKLLGTNYSVEQVLDVLNRLDFNPIHKEDTITVTIPSYRTDIKIQEDITEEVIRIIGFDDLPSTLPKMEATVGALNKKQATRRNIRTLLNNTGLNEAITYTLVSKEEVEDSIMPLNNVVSLALPMSEDRKYVRTSILASLLESISYNQNRNVKNIALYEISNVYQKEKYEERIAIAISGSLQSNRWQKLDVKADFYTLKGILLNILETMGFAKERIFFKENTIDPKNFNPYRSAEVYLGKELIGLVGDIHPVLAKKYSVTDVVMLEVNFDTLLKNKASKVKYVSLNKFPTVTRDLALVVTTNTKASTIVECITRSSKLIKDVEVFDVYTGEHVKEGYKSIALTITIENKEETLTDNVINDVINTVMNNLETKVNAELRK